MTKEPHKRGLGRGLAALLGDDVQIASPPPAGLATTATSLPPAAGPATSSGGPESTSPLVPGTMTIPITWLRPGRFQPRTQFDADRIAELASSIRAHGLIQPLLVRPVPEAPERYEIVAGERRWRAAQQAQLHEVPVVVRPLDDRDTLEIALIENLHRTDLTPIEEARAYRRLMTEFDHTQERLAETIGKSRSHVANLLRLLELPQAVQALVEQGRLEMGHARALIGTPDPAFLADVVIKNKLTARRAEQLGNEARAAAAAGWDGKGLPPSRTEPGSRPAASATVSSGARASAPAKSVEVRALERAIEEALGLKVSIDVTGPAERTQLTIWIETFDQMDEVVDRLTRKR